MFRTEVSGKIYVLGVTLLRVGTTTRVDLRSTPMGASRAELCRHLLEILSAAA